MANAFLFLIGGSVAETVSEKTFPAIAEAAFAAWKAVSWAVCCAEVQVWAVSTFWRWLFA